jgi:hypothetical protein
MRYVLLACLLTLLPLLAAAQIPQAAAAVWPVLRFTHPDAKLLVGIDWRRAVESPLGPLLMKQVEMGGHPLLGFLESIDNVDRLFVSSPGAGGAPGRPPLLVVGEGRFALAKVRAMAKSDGAVSRRYNDVELLVPPDATNADLHFALLDAQTILFGDGLSVKAAIDRHQRGEVPEKNSLYRKAAALSAVQQVWAVVDDPSDALPSMGISSTELAQDVSHIELGIGIAQQFTANLSIETESEETAETLATGLPALLQLAALQFSGQPALSRVARLVKTVQEKTHVLMGFTLDGKLFDQGLMELRAAAIPESAPAQPSARLATPQAAGVAAAAVPVPAPLPAPVPVPAQRKVIRIVGLDEGVREIPYDVSNKP